MKNKKLLKDASLASLGLVLPCTMHSVVRLFDFLGLLATTDVVYVEAVDFMPVSFISLTTISASVLSYFISKSSASDSTKKCRFRLLSLSLPHRWHIRPLLVLFV